MNRVLTFMSVSSLVLLAGCPANEEKTATLGPGHTPQVPPIDCEVTSGPNKGKRGKRTEDGWCEGDWGGTECRPRSKCKDVEASGSGHAGTGITAGDHTGVGVAIEGNPIVGIRPPFGSSPVSYCRRENGFLSVVFENTGNMASPDTTVVTVSFGTTPQTDVAQTRPSIPPGGTVEMSYEIPAGCFSPDCRFSIQWSNQPAVAGICIG